MIQQAAKAMQYIVKKQIELSGSPPPTTSDWPSPVTWSSWMSVTGRSPALEGASPTVETGMTEPDGHEHAGHRSAAGADGTAWQRLRQVTSGEARCDSTTIWHWSEP